MPDDRLQHILSPDAFLGAGQHRLVCRDGQNLLELPLHSVNISVRQVDLVDHRDDGQLLVVRQVDVGHRLRLDTLRRVHDQQCPLAGAQAPRHLVREIDVPRRVDKVQLILHPVDSRVVHRDWVCLDGDAAFLLEIHRVEQLILHFPVGDGAGAMQQTVGKRRLPVVDVRNNAEITNSLDVHVHYSARPVVDHRPTPPRAGQCSNETKIANFLKRTPPLPCARRAAFHAKIFREYCSRSLAAWIRRVAISDSLPAVSISTGESMTGSALANWCAASAKRVVAASHIIMPAASMSKASISEVDSSLPSRSCQPFGHAMLAVDQAHPGSFSLARCLAPV